MKKKVLLLHCPGDKVYLHDYYTSYSSKANYYWPPTDLVLLSGVLREFDLAVIDAIAEKLSPEECENRIKDFKPEAIIFTTGTATWENDLAFLAKLRLSVPSRYIGSSSMFLFEAEYFLGSSETVDALSLSMVSPEIGDFIEGRDRAYPSIAYRHGSDLHLPSPESKKEQNFRIPVPRHDLFKLRSNRSPLAKRTPFALVVTSIGCPFTCQFCVAGSIPYQYRNVDNVIEELRFLKSLGIKEIMFNDPTFTVSEKRVLELCRKMKADGLDFSWVCNGHAATVSDEMTEAMKDAGCHTLMIGVESGQNETLQKYSKNTTPEKIKESFRICKKHRIKTLAYFIIGLPGETRKSVLETIRFARELDCDFASFTVLTPDIGSQLRREAIAKGWLDEKTKAFDSTSFPVFTAGDLTKEEIWKLRQKAVRDFYLRPGYLFKKLMGIRSLKDMTFLVNQALSMFMK
jgi:anaerobic magnesium-protoporphyrin IX monomethyl ester cyclase